MVLRPQWKFWGNANFLICVFCLCCFVCLLLLFKNITQTLKHGMDFLWNRCCTHLFNSDAIWSSAFVSLYELYWKVIIERVEICEKCSRNSVFLCLNGENCNNWFFTIAFILKNILKLFVLVLSIVYVGQE